MAEACEYYWKAAAGPGSTCLCVCMLSHVQLFATPCTVANEAPRSMEFSRQECWSRLPRLTPRALPDPRIEPTSLVSPALAGGFFFTTMPPGKPHILPIPRIITNASPSWRVLIYRELVRIPAVSNGTLRTICGGLIPKSVHDGGVSRA